MTELEQIRRATTDRMLQEGMLVFWQDDADSTLHRGQPWAYTVGRTMYGRPELLVTGLGEALALQVLRELEDQDVHPDFPVTTDVARCAFIIAETGLLHAAFAVFGANYSALQVIWEGEGEQPLHPAGGLIMTDPYPEETE